MNKVIETNLAWSPPLKSSSPRPPGDGEEQIIKKVNECYLQEPSDTMVLPTEKSKSEDISPPSATPPYVKWAEGLHHLLNSDTGIQLFQQYLEQEGCGRNGLDFWLACNGIAKACVKEKSLLRIIYNTLVMNLSEISSQTKRDIAEKLESNTDLGHHIFDTAWKEIEDAIEKTTYPNFLQSDVYISYVQANEESIDKEDVTEELLDEDKSLANIDSKNSCSSKNQFVKEELLPTLYEDKEFVIDNSIPLTRELLQKRAALDHFTFKTKPEAEAGHYLKANTPGYNTAYHAKYASYLPPSAQDSELQSLSSDAHTDTDKSYTDLSTIDSAEIRPKNKKYERHHRSKPDIILNKGSCAINSLPPMPPRIDEKRVQKAADANSEDFWKELLVKLNDLKRQKEHDEYLQEPQAILDAHVSKCIQSWPGSAQQTPGSHTPPPPTLQMPHFENAHKSCSLSHNQPYYYNKPNNPQYLQLDNVHQHREHDAYSCDSGTVRDYSSDIAPSLASHNYGPDAHHHNLMSSGERRRFKEQVKRYTGKKPSHWESQSTFDSGVSLTNVSLPNESQQQKVTEWLGTSHPLKSKSSDVYESERSLALHHKKSPPLSPICGQPFKKSSTNSSAGAYSAYSQSHWNAQQTNGLFEGTVVCGYGFAALSSAKSPLAQDPNMSMLPSTNADATVDECIRRLSAGNSYQRPKSNRSTSTGRERNPFENAKSKSFSKGFDSSEDNTLHNRKSGRKSYPNMMPSNFLSSSVDCPKQESKISVAYCFGNGTVPYLSKLSGKDITLRQFKSLISKKGNFKYFFKKRNEELGIVLEEVTEDNEILPLFEGKIFSVIETID